MRPDLMAGMQRVLEEMRDNPLGILPVERQKEIRRTADALACPVCERMATSVRKRAEKFRRVNELWYVEALEKICQGEKTQYTEIMGYTMPDSLPSWLSHFEASTENGKYVLMKTKKKRKKSREGFPEAEKGEDDFENVQTLLKACNLVLETVQEDELALRLHRNENPCTRVCERPKEEEL